MVRRFAALTAGATFLLLIAGSVVTSTDSGLAVPDWPLSYGTLFPPMVGGIRFEHGHRLIASVVGLLIMLLSVWVWRIEPRRWVRRLGIAALAAVIVQGLLGGITVLLLLPPQVSIAHACLGPAVFCLATALAAALSPSWVEHPVRAADAGRPSLRALGLAVALAAAGQLFLGAVIRHTGAAIGAHLAGAATLAITTAWFLARAHPRRAELPSVWRAALRLAGLLMLQVAVGTGVFWHRRALLPRTAHVALGSLILAHAMLLAWDARRRTERRGHSPHVPAAGRWRDYLELTKPRLSLLVLATTAAGFWLGLRMGEPSGRGLPLFFGMALVVGGANVMNEWWERVPDAQMHRTQHRPVPAGRLAPRHALLFGLGSSLAGFVMLAAAVNGLCAALAAASWVSYVLLYTPLKRVTPLCTLVGAIPGALPPVIGWAAARNTIGLEAAVLGTLLFVWQLPHFLAIAVLYRDDYARAGFKMLPVVERDGRVTARQIILYGLVLLPVSLFPSLIGLGGPAYFYGALVLSAAFLLLAVRSALVRSHPASRQLFLASVIYLPMLLGLLAWNRGAAAAPLLVTPVAPAAPDLGLVPDFSLIDHQRRPVTRGTFEGRVWIADFVFTRCAGQCPLMSAQMAALQRRFTGEPSVQLLSVTVDPVHDTPETLAAYAGRYGADGGRWRFATGEAKAIARLARDGFHLGISDGDTPEEPITHSARFVLVDQRGRLRGLYDATDAQAMARLAADAQALVWSPTGGARGTHASVSGGATSRPPTSGSTTMPPTPDASLCEAKPGGGATAGSRGP